MGSPWTHFIAETGDKHHFAWPDKDPATPDVTDIYYDFRPRGGFANLITEGQIAAADVHEIHNAVAWMDYRERWDETIGNGDKGNSLDYFTVAAHEIGHALGLGHMDDEPDFNLMNNSYCCELTGASIVDTEHVIVVYGATPGFIISPSSGLETSEDGGKARIVVKLRTQPTSDVTITLTSSDPTEGQPEISTLTFTPSNWDRGRVLFVIGQDDAERDGDIPYLIVTGPALSADPDYDGLDPVDLTVINLDNEKGGGKKGGGKGNNKPSATVADGALGSAMAAQFVTPIGPALRLANAIDPSGQPSADEEWNLQPSDSAALPDADSVASFDAHLDTSLPVPPADLVDRAFATWASQSLDDELLAQITLDLAPPLFLKKISLRISA